MEEGCRGKEWVIFSATVSAVAVLLSPLRFCLGSSDCEFPAIFNFGDSNSDTGGLSAAFGQAQFPNGVTFFHAPAGRYCDGRLIIDFMAEGLGLPHLSAYLDSVGSNFSHGANFATAGSTVRPQNTTKSQSGYSPISLDVQSVEFSDFHSRSQKILRQKGGSGIFKELLPKEEYFSHALYTIDIGQNDITAGYKLNMTTEQVMSYIPDVVDQVVDAIRLLYDSGGGRSFWIHNTGPLGCLPYVLDRYHVRASSQIDRYGCATPFNDVSQYYNQHLRKAVIQLRKELPYATLIYVDVYAVKYKLIAEAEDHGFRHPLVACCGHGGRYNFNNGMRCGFKEKVGDGGGSSKKGFLIAKSCKDPSVKVIWDGIHYTEAANKWVFDQIVNGRFSDPPVSLKMACRRTQLG